METPNTSLMNPNGIAYVCFGWASGIVSWIFGALGFVTLKDAALYVSIGATLLGTYNIILQIKINRKKLKDS